MIPLTTNPSIVILINKNRGGLVETIATNISPNVNVKIVTTVTDFHNEAINKSFLFHPGTVVCEDYIPEGIWQCI
jgi:hypothetical protein